MKDKKEELLKKMKNTEDIRDVTIIAHVDHGKTSLSDSLLAQDGLMNIKDAGRKLKLDDDEIEQKRQMTVYSSYVTISYKHRFAVDNTDFMIQCQTCGLTIFQEVLRDYREDFDHYSKDKPPGWYVAAVRHWLQTDHNVQSILQDTVHRDVISDISADLRKSGKTKEQIRKENGITEE
jgi:hypothetical protein